MRCLIVAAALCLASASPALAQGTNGIPGGTTGSGAVALATSPTLTTPIVTRYTVSTLPTCNSSLHGAIAAVTDATTPTYNGALTGGSTVEVPVYCNGSAWTSH